MGIWSNMWGPRCSVRVHILELSGQCFWQAPPPSWVDTGPWGSPQNQGEPISPSSAPQNCFELYIPDSKDQVIKACKTEADGRVVEGNHTVYRISAPTAEEKDEWMKSVK